MKISILHREMAALDFTGHYSLVRDYLGPRRPDPLAPPPAPPSIRCVTGSLTRQPDSFDADERLRLKAVLTRCPHLDTLTGHVTAFAEMMSNLDGHLLDDWICAVLQDDLPDLAFFANGLLQDYDAVRAGLTLPFSSGAVEGHVNRVKMLKRQMYGRANLDLLRQRVLHSG